jgi:hypothetical protein
MVEEIVKSPLILNLCVDQGPESALDYAERMSAWYDGYNGFEDTLTQRLADTNPPFIAPIVATTLYVQ